MRTKIHAAGLAAGIAALLLAVPPPAGAQETMPPPPPPVDSAQFSAAQLEQLLAPIALYPDSLLAQILMAATYPLEIVQADRWLQDPANAALKGGSLDAALEQQSWDPSVKSLVPFPQILRMMDSNLGWTEQLGDAFLSQQAAVTDAIQHLRLEAQAAGRLQSTPEQIVSAQDSAITIEPADPSFVYVPVYDPAVAYGMWPYSDFPPYYFPDAFGVTVIGSLGFAWISVGIDAPLWGWSRWNWRQRQIYLDPGRFNAINARHRPPVLSGAWRHDPSHRGRIPYRDPGTRAHFGNDAPEAPGGRRVFRGYPETPAPAAPSSGPPQERRHRQGQPPPMQPRAPAAPPPAFESFGRGSDVHTQSERGRASRGSAPAAHGDGGARRPPSGAPASGDRRRR